MAIKIKNFVIDKISYENKMRIQTFRKINFGYWTVDTIFLKIEK